MEVQEFGVRLRELRTQAGLSQRELADKAGINFTYLSKIECGVMPPPSEKVMLRLADVLNADKDELMSLSSRIPSDIAQILKDRKTLQRLRSNHTHQMVKAVKKQEGTTHIVKPLKSYKGLSKVAIPIILVAAVAASLWFASPVTDTAAASNREGVSYNNSGEYHKAMEAFTNAIKLDPNFALAYNNRGWAYIELGQYEQAIADCTKAIELDPSLALAYNNRGWAYIELGQY
ncbi:tetratricopeptide repeat protein, partial [Chloroflexota bacterium]